MIHKSCVEFVDLTASKAPVPGGGGVSSMVGALGIALGSMVGNLTVGKKKYADVQDDIQAILGKAKALQDELMDLVLKDAESFEPLAKAYSLPKETPEEKAEKDKIMEAALRDACIVPMTIMEKCYESMKLQEELAAKGTKIALSDVGVGVMLLKSALIGASLNIYINASLMKDGEYAAQLSKKCDDLVQSGSQLADKVFESVMKEIRG